MKRALPIALTAACLALPLFCGASEMLNTYDAVEYNQNVFINGRAFLHNSPIMEINDRLYVSLEDFADYRGYVYHPKNEGTIEITTEYSDGRAAFEKLMEITLPATADIKEWNYSVTDEFEKNFVAHVELTAADLETLLPVISESYVEFESQNSSYDTEMNKEYSWWNSEVPPSTRFFKKWTQGTVVKTVNLYIRISPTSTGKYELFASR